MTKTNKNWYAYPNMGTYYQLQDGVLMFCPMLKDGSRSSDEEIGEVDIDIFGTELADIIKSLKTYE